MHLLWRVSDWLQLHASWIQKDNEVKEGLCVCVCVCVCVCGISKEVGVSKIEFGKSDNRF